MARPPQYVQLRFPKDPELQGTNRILAGIALIASHDVHAELAVGHDQLFFGSYESAARMTEAERELLEAWGWIESEESWSHFV